MFLFVNFFVSFKSIIFDLFSIFDLSGIAIDFDYNDSNMRLEFGDVSTNIALLLAKRLKKNPKEIINLIKNKVELLDYVEKVESAGIGFINIYFKDEIYRIYYKNLLMNFDLLFQKIENNKKYNIEFVSANPTGPLHIGHGRGGIIGDVCSKILKLKGFTVATEYYINDAGSQILKLGKSVYYQYALLCNKSSILPDNGYQGEYIIELAKVLYKKNKDSLLDNTIDWFSNYAMTILLKDIKKTLGEYQICFDVWFSEKKLHDNFLIENAIDLLLKKGFVYTTGDNVVWFKATLFGDEKDRVLKKSDGSWTYTAADIAYFLNKLERGFSHIIMILGQDHHSFKIRIEAIAKAFGFDTTKLNIILYQLVTLKNEGEVVRMSKRKGNGIELQDIIDTVGSDVARFFYLQRKADAHLEFDIREALEKSNKNPVFYIQYALVRIKSILEKANGLVVLSDYYKAIDSIIINKHERVLLRKINLFDSILEQICFSLNPHILTYYTIELASLFHSFYTLYPIISDEKNNTHFRLGLSYLVKKVLEKCVVLLGITIPERM